MKEAYEVRLINSGELIEYRDGVDAYHFNARRKRTRWTVYLPGTKGKCPICDVAWLR